MDLSFARFHGPQVTTLPVELAVLMVGVASRQAASPTARVQARLGVTIDGAGLLAPRDGSFSLLTATALTAWKDQ